MGEAPDKPTRRLPRFSLRSLILFVVLAGSGYGLWHNRASWQHRLVLERHSHAIESVAYSSDGQRIVTASYDNTARVWDATDGNSLTVLAGHSSIVVSAAYSPDDKRIVTSSWDNTARIWRRHRPEQWWGMAWLPEFWLTAALGLLLVWSLRGDTIRFRQLRLPNGG